MGFIRFKWVRDDRNDNILFEKTFSKKKSKKDFILAWEKHIGWDGNPFNDEILKPVKEYIGGFKEEKKNLNLFLIEGRRFGIISGKDGSGKSMLLRWVEESLSDAKGDYIVAYLDCKNLKFDNFFKEIAKNFVPSFKKALLNNLDKQKVFKIVKERTSKKIVFIVDDFHELSKVNMQFLNDLFNSTRIQVILSINPDKNKSIDISGFGDDSLRVKLSKMDSDSAREMVKKRIESVGGIDIDPLNDVILKTISKKAEFNPRKILSLCNKKAVELALGKKDEIEDEEIAFEEEQIFQNTHSVEVPEEEQRPLDDVEVVYEGDKIVQEILNSGKTKKKK